MNANDILTVQEAADYLNVKVRFIRRLVDARRVRYHSVGRFVRFRRRDLDEFVANGVHEIGEPKELRQSPRKAS